MRFVSTDHGWVSSSPGDNSHQSDEARQLIRDRRERRGELLAVVAVRVYEHEAEPQVTFPPEALLDVDTDQAVVSELVRRAQVQLERWR
jgi:hypothetical protein